jgi:hypothetical protein
MLFFYHEGSSLDSWRTNHDKVHLVPAVKRFLGERVAVDPLNFTVLGVPQHQTIETSKMTRAFGRLLRFQRPQKSLNL